MPSEILGLFTTPEQYQQNQLAQFRSRAFQESQLDPFQQAALGARTAGFQLGQGIGGALGGVDPQLQKITQRQQLLNMIDPANPDSYAKAIQAALQTGDQEAAFLLRNEMMKVQQQAFTTRKATAEAEKAELSVTQEKNFRDELSELVNPTEEDIVRIATKYGSSDKVLSIVQTSITRAKDRQERLDIANEREQGRLDIAKDRIQAQKDRDLDKATTQKERDEAQRKFDERMKLADRDSKQALAKIAASLKQAPAPTLTTIQNPENPSETITVDARIYKGGGKNALGVIGLGKPSATQEKATLLKTQMGKDLDFAIAELTDVTKDGGLIDQSTGSGAGRLVDIGAGFVGKATKGSIAIGKLQPIADMSLKMVPRFEGPQSNADTKSYKEAAGQLADPTLPTEIRKEAGKTVLRLMKERKNQFVTPELAAEGIGASQPSNQSSGQTSKGTKFQILPD